MAELDNDIARYLSIRRAFDPSFSPDGRTVAFLMDATGKAQVWAVPVRGGRPRPLTFFEDRVRIAAFAPEGERIVCAMDFHGDERLQLYLLDVASRTATRLTHDSQAIHLFGGWSRDGRAIAFAANRRHPAYFDIYVQPLDGEARCVFEADGNAHPLAWLPDGSAIIVRRVRSNSDTDLYLVDVRDHSVRHLTPHEGEAYYGSVSAAPDSRRLYLVTDAGREHRAPAALDLPTGKVTLLADRPWNAEICIVSRDGARLAWTTNVEGYSELAFFYSGSAQRLVTGALPPGVVEAMTWSPNGRYLAVRHSGPRHTDNIWLIDPGRDRVRQLTHASRAGLRTGDFAEPQLVRYPSFDGMQVPALFYEPVGRRNPPAVVLIHGGPEGQARPRFDRSIQYWVHRGYAVLAPNVRGSTGYGRAYSHLDDGRLRVNAIHDLEYANRWLRACGRVDPRRIAVMGASYGGFMALAALAFQPEVWAAGISMAGMANLLTFMLLTGAARRSARASKYGDIERDAEFLRDISPVSHVDAIRAPLLVIHGANDPRVPVIEAEQIVSALRDRGHPVEYLRFADEGHGIDQPHNQVRAHRLMTEFLDRYLAAPMS